MEDKKENRSARRSRRLIRQAFLELLEEKSFDKITVLELADRADVNRSTFYAHYPDIYGVAEEIQNEIIQRYTEQFHCLAYHCFLENPMPYLDAMAAALEENQALSRKIGHALPIDRGLREFARVMEENMLRWPDIPEEVKSEPAFAVRIQFFLGGIINTFLLWEKGQLSCSREVVCQQIAVMIRQSASDFLNKDWTRWEKNLALD